MGTRSLTCVMDEYNNEIVNIYRQFDGYPTGHGQELVDFLRKFEMVNGIAGNETRRIANGMGCLAAQIVTHLKGGMAKDMTYRPEGSRMAGGIYLYYPGARDCGEEYIYTVRLDSATNKLHLKVQVGAVTMFGLPGTKEANMPSAFDGPLSDWDAQEIEDKASKLRNSTPNDFLKSESSPAKATRKSRAATKAKP